MACFSSASRLRTRVVATSVLTAAGAMQARAEDDAQLAKQLSNPVAALISVPIQANYDRGMGSDSGGHKWTINVQPVVPMTLNSDWNIISRTIVPIVSQTGVVQGSGSQAGLGDTVQSLFLSPKRPTANGIIWGAGPVFLFPTGTDPLLSARKWAAGPTAVGLAQVGPWTVGMLGNHIWSFAGSGSNNVNSTFLQPFVSYTTDDAWTFSLNTESTYDWERHRWSIPLNAVMTKLVKVGSQPVSFGAGLRYWAASAPSGPSGWGARAVVTFLFPRGP
ncbi:hypothetical protein [Paraburkholderia dilworthii]|uniref:hypothetical protein n=1 Tax=Paraburkholderia dilworthii TaxID=948106 RepID=UPI000688C36F|nr:hypothetical protein [Paraburkholderia dilworthii]